MKFTKYMKIVQVADGYYFLVNGLNGAIDTIDQKGYELCQKWQDEEFIDASIDMKAYQYLLERGYLTEPGQDEIKRQELITQLRNNFVSQEKHLALYFILTYDCNFRCAYCYEKQLLKKGSDWIQKRMDIPMVRAIYDYLDKEKYQLSPPFLYGGEPLLPKNMETVEEILTQNQKRQLSTGIVSNGYYLEDYIDLLKNHDIKEIHITLDGTAEVHNKTRFTATGEGTFDKILKGIIKAEENDIPIRIRSNIYPQKENTTRELITTLQKMGLVDNGKNPLYIYPIFGDKPGMCEIEEDTMTQFMEKIDDLQELGVPREKLFALIHHLSSAFFGGNCWNPKYTSCGAVANLRLIDPSGFVYPCQALVGIEEEAVGHFDGEKIMYNEKNTLWHQRSIETMEKCQNCWAALFCGGGCGYRALKGLGDLSAPECKQTENLVANYLPYFFKKLVLPNLNSSERR